jgi:hypothetical protein
LRWRQCHRAIDNWRPDETALLKTLGDQPETAAIPVEAFEIIAVLATENEEMPTERIIADSLAAPSPPGRQTRCANQPGNKRETP